MRPTLYEHAGGAPAMLALAAATTRRCRAEPELSHAFDHGMRPDHDDRLAAYWTEVLGGPARYSGELAQTQTHMVRLHAGEHEPDDWKQRFVGCFVAALDDADLPDDPEFRTAMRAYMEWAVTDTNTYPDSKDDVPDGLSVPRWGWAGLTSPAR